MKTDEPLPSLAIASLVRLGIRSNLFLIELMFAMPCFDSKSCFRLALVHGLGGSSLERGLLQQAIAQGKLQRSKFLVAFSTQSFRHVNKDPASESFKHVNTKEFKRRQQKGLKYR